MERFHNDVNRGYIYLSKGALWEVTTLETGGRIINWRFRLTRGRAGDGCEKREAPAFYVISVLTILEQAVHLSKAMQAGITYWNRDRNPLI